MTVLPTYVVLVNWTEEGTELAKKHGAQFKQAFRTVGPYDMVAVFESPDDETRYFRTHVSFILPPLEMLTSLLPGAATRVMAPGTITIFSVSGARAWMRKSAWASRKTKSSFSVSQSTWVEKSIVFWATYSTGFSSTCLRNSSMSSLGSCGAIRTSLPPQPLRLFTTSSSKWSMTYRLSSSMAKE